MLIVFLIKKKERKFNSFMSYLNIFRNKNNVKKNMKKQKSL